MIIQTLLDTDLYKFTMMQAVLHRFPAAQVEYTFHCRTPGIDLRPCRAAIEAEIEQLCTLRFTAAELEYLGGLRYIKSDFVEFLRLFRFQERFVHIAEQDGRLTLKITGPWLHTILFEVPLLAIISETWHRMTDGDLDLAAGREKLAAKIARVRALPEDSRFGFADFGTRRRLSRAWQEEVVYTFARELPGRFRGTSNVHLARHYGLLPIGTMAHEFIQACQALGPRLRDSQRFAFECWAREYRGDLGIALSDTYGLKPFLRDFDLYFCKLFDGARQDSGDPHHWAEQVIAHYRHHRVDPAGKTLVFSDNLTIDKAIAIDERFGREVKTAFGIGTHLTNDAGVKPINIVIKMTACNGQPVAKLSDSPGKTMCDDETYLAWLRQAYDLA